MKTRSSPPLHVLPLALALGLGLAAPAKAQHAGHTGHDASAQDTQASTEPHAHGQPAAAPTDHAQMDHSKMDHDAMRHGTMDHGQHGGHARDHGADHHAGMDHPPSHAGNSDAPREPIPPVTAEDLAAAFPDVGHHAMQHASPVNFKVTFNRLEAWDGDHGTGQAWEGIAWVGTDTDRLWLRSEGERMGGRTESADLEALYGRSVSAWWDVVAGVKHDFKPGGARTWAALGVQGLAPYRFEVSATAYVGESGHVAANVEAEYTLRLTNRLILQPLAEADFSAKDDPRHGIGSGLNKVEAGLRLRYEFTRRFAPYVGMVHERSFGDTADHRRAEGEHSRDTRVVAGVRIWF